MLFKFYRAICANLVIKWASYCERTAYLKRPSAQQNTELRFSLIFHLSTTVCITSLATLSSFHRSTCEEIRRDVSLTCRPCSFELLWHLRIAKREGYLIVWQQEVLEREAQGAQCVLEFIPLSESLYSHDCHLMWLTRVVLTLSSFYSDQTACWCWKQQFP